MTDNAKLIKEFLSTEPFEITLIKKGVTKTELSKALGMSTRTIAKFKNLESVNLSTIVRICRYLNVPIEEVVQVKLDSTETQAD